MSPLRPAIGAGLGIAEAEPMDNVVAAANALKPVPSITMTSSGAASAGVMVMEAFGTAKLVVVPWIEPTFATTILLPGESDPPVLEAGTSVVKENAPSASAEKPPVGIALAPPKVRIDPVVLGGKPEPVTVTTLPVGASAGSTVTTPAATLIVVVAALPLDASEFNSSALSVAVSVNVATVASTGMVRVPVPVPSDATGNSVVPDRVPALIVIVNLAVVAFSESLTVIPVTETSNDSPGAAVALLAVSVRAVLLNPEEVPIRPPLSVAVIVYESLVRTAEASMVSMVVV
jgi:hypothetical protein